MSNYVKHDVSLDLKEGVDTVNGTSGNDALFCKTSVPAAMDFGFQDAGGQSDGGSLIWYE